MTFAFTASIDQIEALGWRQGSIVASDLARKILDEIDIPAGIEFDSGSDFLIVISQDCDLVNPKLKNEPWCEVLVAKPTKNRDAFHGKNPRRIQFSLGSAGLVECSIHDKFRFPREFLAMAQPASEPVADERLLKQLRDWITKRYVRAAFPGTFNDRYKGVKSRIEAALSGEGGELLVEVFIELDSYEELSEDVSYAVNLFGAMYDDEFDDPGKLKRVRDALLAVSLLLGDCDGIEVDNYIARARRNITLTDLDTLKRWDYLDPISSRIG